MTQAIQMMLNQLKAKNPQIFQIVEQARQNQNNPMELFKQITSNYSDEQMNNFYKQAEQMGFDKNLIDQVKKDISAKEH